MPASSHPKAVGRGGIAVAILGLALVFTAPFASGQKQRTPENPQGKWEVLEGCTLSTDGNSDGDSFHVLHKGRTYIFRLYFVDAPEVEPPRADAAIKQRIREQAALFGIASSDVTRGGSLAAQFSREKLREHEFKVVTRWQPVTGPGGRFYCVLLVKGEDLAEALVANGLARIHGLQANWPDKASSKTFFNKLKNLELTARGSQRGLWDEKAFPRIPSNGGKVPAKPPGKIRSGTVNINEASLKELQTLPGIGAKLGERIIANRPYQFVDDLLKVPGIGTNILEQLRGLVRTE
jgi:competence ComEA-like helix-hairpin-helix protein